MAGPQPAAPTSLSRAEAPDEGLLRLWYVRLPRAVESYAPRLADALADGAWTAVLPRLAAYAPLAGAALGVIVGLLYPLVPSDLTGYPRVWSELLPFMMVVIAAGLLSGTVSVAILAGYIAGDLARFLLTLVTESGSFFYGPLAFSAGYLGSALISYLLLAIPAVTAPLIARDLADRAPVQPIASAPPRKILRAAGYVVAAGVLIFFWTRAVVVLIRPVFTWPEGGNPTVEAIRPVQLQWDMLVAAAVLAAIARLILQELVMGKSRGASQIAALQGARSRGARPGAFWDRLGPVPRIAVMAGTATLLLAGTYEAPIDAILVFAIAALVGAWRMGIIRTTSPWARKVERVPALARIVVAAIAGYLLARTVVELLFETNSLRPVLIGILLVLAVFIVLFPTPVAARPRQRTVESA